MAATKNIGTLNIKIAIAGATETKKDLADINKGITGLGKGAGIHGILSKFNELRWAALAVGTAVKILAGPFKTTATHAVMSLKVIKTAMQNSLFLPVTMAQKSVDMLANSMKVLGAAAAVGFVALGTSGTKSLAEVDTSIRNALPLFEEAAGMALPNLDKQILTVSQDLSEKFGKSMVEVTDAFYDFASAGIPAATALAAMEQATRFSLASQLELGDAVQFTFSTMRAFNLFVENSATNLGKFGGEAGVAAENVRRMEEVQDTMAASVLQSQMRFTDLRGALAQVAPVAGKLEADLNEVTSALAVFANAGVRGSTAGTALKTMMGRLAKDAGDAHRALMQLGLQASDFDARDLGKSFELITERLNDIGVYSDRAKAVFDLLGLRGAKGAAIFSDAGVTAFNNYVKAGQEAEGTTRRIADVVRQSLGVVIERIKGSFNALKLNVVKSFAGKDGFLTKLADTLIKMRPELEKSIEPLFDNWNTWLGEKLPAAVEWFASSLSKAQPLLLDVFGGMQRVIGGITNGLQRMGSDLYQFLVEAPENGITRWEMLKNTLSNIWTSIETGISKIYSSIKDSNIFQSVFSWFVTNGSSIVGTITDIATVISGELVGAWQKMDIVNILDTVKASVESFASWLTTKFEGKTGAERLGETFDSMAMAVSDAVSVAGQVITGFFGDMNGGGATGVLESTNELFKSISRILNDTDPAEVVAAMNNLADAFVKISESSIGATLDTVFGFLSNKEAVANISELVTKLHDMSKLLAGIGEWFAENKGVSSGMFGGLLALIGLKGISGGLLGAGAAAKGLGAATTGAALTGAGGSVALVAAPVAVAAGATYGGYKSGEDEGIINWKSLIPGWAVGKSLQSFKNQRNALAEGDPYSPMEALFGRPVEVIVRLEPGGTE